jgi:hypothetical protein
MYLLCFSFVEHSDSWRGVGWYLRRVWFLLAAFREPDAQRNNEIP